MHSMTHLTHCTAIKPPLTCKPLAGGNMNEVILVQDSLGKEVVIKYAPPYLHMLGPSFPLAQERIHVEMHALEYFGAIAPSFVPRVLDKDEANFCMFLEYKKGFITLREIHMLEQFNPSFYAKLGAFVGALATHTPPPKPAGYYENAALKAITNEYVFTIAFLENSDKTMLHVWFVPLPKSTRLLENVALLKTLFHTPSPHLAHGDLHTGSVLVHDEEIAVIDAEFALFGPISFDIGNLFAHIIMDGFGREFSSNLAIVAFWESFIQNSKLTCKELEAIFSQSVGFCGVEIARRLVVPAKSPALESLKSIEEAYAQMDALSCKLIEEFQTIGTLDALSQRLP